MEVIENNSKIKCELGVCKNRASKAIKFDRVGIRSRIYVCDKCLGELYSAIGEVLVPKSVETAKRATRKKDGGK